MKLNLILMIIALSFACVESEEKDAPSNPSIPTEQNLDDSKADRIVQWRVRDSDTTFWFESGFRIKNKTGKVIGRTSRNILNLSARFSSGKSVPVKRISPRKFELELNEKQIIKAAAGDAIITTVDTSVGKRHLFTRFSARLHRFKGDHRIYVLSSMNAIYVGDRLTFRGRVNTAAGWQLLNVRSSDEEGRLVPDPTLNPFDFDADKMANILADSSKLTFNAHDGGRQYITKNVNFGLKLNKLAAADLPPSQAWPSQTCDPQIHACLRTYKGQDFETCGYANQVTACWSPQAIDFSRRLKEEITQFFDKNPRQIRSQNGRSKKAALARISPNKVGQVDPLEDEDDSVDTQENDIVVYHPGVIFRRSSVLWQGHYNKKGEFQYLEKVN